MTLPMFPMLFSPAPGDVGVQQTPAMGLSASPAGLTPVPPPGAAPQGQIQQPSSAVPLGQAPAMDAGTPPAAVNQPKSAA